MTLGEADTRAKLIDPALYQRGWTEAHMKREVTAGAVEIVDGRPRRRAKGRADYTLRIPVNSETQPVAVAVIEAKPESLPPAHGIDQAKAYASCKRLNVPFVFSSNGHLFVEYDSCTGLTAPPRPLSEFPTPEELRARYEKAKGFRLTDPEAKPLLARYPGGEATRRYYQDAALRAALEKVARTKKEGQAPRALLSLATGAGKTFVAVQILKRFADAGQLVRALFVCDRDELRSQAAGAFQNVFGSDADIVSTENPQKNARVLIATYQTLDLDRDEADANFLTAHYPAGYFTHIVIDECHRSAWGKWSQVLTRNPTAVQIGLTATPRQLILSSEATQEAGADAQVSADNVRYFGEPVYEYDIGQGIEDGYLAACEIVKGSVSLDADPIAKEEVIDRNPTDVLTGQPVGAAAVRDAYEKTSYEDRLALPDRVQAMCADLFERLLATGGPEQKTIVFCVRDRHADEVAIALNNLYAVWCAKEKRARKDPFAFKCTASVGGDALAELRGSSGSHFAAATVELLTTGVDVPAVRNVVFFKYVRSPIAFYQMVGRGTRLDPATDKLMFRIYDYTDATRLFGSDFLTKYKAPTAEEEGGVPGPPAARQTIVVQGFNVQVNDAGRSILTTDADGKTLPVTLEEYKRRLAARLVEEVPTLAAFRARWVNREERRDLLGRLPEGGRSAFLVQPMEEMDDYDLYDVLAEIGYGLAPRTRTDRAAAFAYKHGAWLASLPPTASATLRALSIQFARAGTEGLENPQVFQTPEVVAAGGLEALKALGKPADVLRDAKERMFAT